MSFLAFLKSSSVKNDPLNLIPISRGKAGSMLFSQFSLLCSSALCRFLSIHLGGSIREQKSVLSSPSFWWGKVFAHDLPRKFKQKQILNTRPPTPLHSLLNDALIFFVPSFYPYRLSYYMTWIMNDGKLLVAQICEPSFLRVMVFDDRNWTLLTPFFLTSLCPLSEIGHSKSQIDSAVFFLERSSHLLNVWEWENEK